MSIVKKLSIATAGAALITLGSATTAKAVAINFDTDANGNPINAPSLSIETTRLTDLYAPLGVRFNGPGGNDGGAIIDQNSNFGVPARSGRNFLAFNRFATLSDGGIATDPESISFDTPLSNISIFASGGGSSNLFQLDAFNSTNVLIGNTVVLTSPGTYGELSFSSPSDAISRVVLTSLQSDFFVYDDLTFTPVPVPVPEFSPALSFLTLGAWGAMAHLKRKGKQKALKLASTLKG